MLVAAHLQASGTELRIDSKASGSDVCEIVTDTTPARFFTALMCGTEGAPHQ